MRGKVEWREEGGGGVVGMEVEKEDGKEEEKEDNGRAMATRGEKPMERAKGTEHERNQLKNGECEGHKAAVRYSMR